MKKSLFLISFILLSVFLSGCDSPKRTVEMARKQLAEYKAAPSDTKQAAIEESLAKLDMQIARLEKKGNTAQADFYRKQAASLRSDFQAMRIARALHDAKNAVQGIGEAFKEAGKIFNETLDNASQKTNEP